MKLKGIFTSTGHKFFAHEEAMTKLRNGQGQPIVTHVMLTDVCNHKCAFCSVQHRTGDSLPFEVVQDYLRILMKFGLKAVILSGGGNPILYRCKDTGADFDDVVDWIHLMGLEIGLITNGMPLKDYTVRRSWKTVRPGTLDKLTWVRISMSGLDHDEGVVYVPDIDPTRTTLGFSYCAHDVYDAPEDKAHGKVSTVPDVINLGGTLDGRKVWKFEDRIEELTNQIQDYALKYRPQYIRALPNCLEPDLIPLRCKQLQMMSNAVNFAVGRDIMFVQQKPPSPPNVCLLGFIHPVLNCDEYVYPCDSCVLNKEADHKFANPWRICHWSDIASIYERPVRSLIDDPKTRCPGCVFTQSNIILEGVWNGQTVPVPLTVVPDHVNFP